MSSSRESNCSDWKRRLRPLALTLYFLALVLVVPVVVWQLQRHHANIHTQAWFIAGIFLAFTVPVSLWGIVQHVVHLSRPDLQGPMIRILWMVPVYSLDSWACLIWPDYVSHLETVRDVYEAIATYSLMTLLVNFLQAQYPNLGEVLEAKEPHRPPFPFCCFTRWPRGERLLRLCQRGMRQYIAVTVFYGLLANICEFLKVYEKGTVAWSSAWLYLAVIKVVSKVVALFSLWAFYQNVKEEAKPMEFGKKFASVRLVLLLTFWQSLLIALLVKLGVISSSSTWGWQSAQAVGAGLQNFALCVEMFVAAIGFHYTYSYTPYMEEQVGGTFCSLFLEIWNISPTTPDILTQDTFSGSTQSSRHTEQDECVIQVSSSEDTVSTSTDNQPDTGHTLPSLY